MLGLNARLFVYEFDIFIIILKGTLFFATRNCVGVNVFMSEFKYNNERCVSGFLMILVVLINSYVCLQYCEITIIITCFGQFDLTF